MTQTSERDLALETLLEMRREVAPDLDEALVRSCYAIQKRHQFDDSRGASAQAMDKLIEETLNALGQEAGA
jgi:hypothetical protein